MDYLKYKNITIDLLKRYGQTGRYVAFDSNGKETSLAIFHGISLPITKEDIDNTLVKDCNTSMFLVFEDKKIKLNQDDYLKWNGELYKVMFLREYKPTNLVIVYEVFLSQ